MSELRKDPVNDRWVVIAPDRAIGFPKRAPAEPPGVCPFCPGNEKMTPPEIAAARSASQPNGPGWSVRVVPNRIPAVRTEEVPNRRDGLFEHDTGLGAHEVVIETPDHNRDFAGLSVDEMTAVLWMWSERLRDLARDERLFAPAVFRHRGREAGATVDHAHSQILVLPVAPLEWNQEWDRSEELFRERGGCVWCEVIGQERKDRARIVDENTGAVAICPWASRVPFETAVFPIGHQCSFERESKETLRAIAEVLRRTLHRIDAALERPPCSIALRTGPLRAGELPGCHWRIEILPVLAPVTLASGTWINPVAPEEAAEVLRKAGK